MTLYKINDIINCEFLKIPKTMFASDEYRKLSSDAKLTYALLYDRLSLSKLNGWINENDEVYLIYTREEIAADLGITYKKAISAFKELLGAGLISEQRCGRGMPNKIFIVKLELTEKQAKKYVKRENLRTADSVCLEEEMAEIKTCQNSISEENSGFQDMPDTDIKNFQNGTSRTAETECLDMPDSLSNKTYINKTYNNHTENSQSVSQHKPFRFYTGSAEEISSDRQTDNQYDFDEIIENCELHLFDDEERKILYDALERMFYSDGLKIGNAKLPQDKVRSRMYEIDGSILQSAMHNLHKNETEISNITGYVMSTIFNCITEEYSLLHVDPYLNMMRRTKLEV